MKFITKDSEIEYLKLEVKELEAQGAVDRATCRWCGTIHARKMNILCPLTIAEAKLDAVKNCDTYWSTDTPNFHVVKKCDLDKAIGEQE